MMKLIVTDDPYIGDSSVRLNGKVLAWGFSSAQDAIGACAEELTAAGINVPKIWDILEEEWDPTSSLTWYEAVVEKKRLP